MPAGGSRGRRRAVRAPPIGPTASWSAAGVAIMRRGDGLISIGPRRDSSMKTRRRHALALACAAAAVAAPAAQASPLKAGGPVDLLTEANVRIEGLASAAKVGDKVAPA